MKQADFIAAIAPAARASAKLTGIPASFTIAQAAHESGWGKSELAAVGKNLFGVKADSAWHGDTLMLPTTEYVAGKPITVKALWRSYPNWQGCMDDHAAFLRKNPRYAKCFVASLLTGEQFAHAVADAGYATDPNYAAKVIATMRSHNLQQFDQP